MTKKNNKENPQETPQDIMKNLMYHMRSKRVTQHVDTVIDDIECISDTKEAFNRMASEQARFHYIESHLFAWSAVLSDDLCDMMDCLTDLRERLHVISKRLDKLDGGAEDNEDDEDGNGDNDFTFGGF